MQMFHMVRVVFVRYAIVAASVLLFIQSASAANLVYSTDATISLASPAVNWTITSGSTASSLVVGTGSIAVTLGSGQSFTVTSATDITVVAPGMTTGGTCSSGIRSVVLTGTGTATLTPGSAPCVAASSVPSTSVGGGGFIGPFKVTSPFSSALPLLDSMHSSYQTTPTPVCDPSTAAYVDAEVQSSADLYAVTLSEGVRVSLTQFVMCGTTVATVNLGAGERLALVRDQLETLGRVSITALEQLASGQKPTDRNLAKERARVGNVLSSFKKLIGHAPNFKNPNEDLAWNTMMYRVRFDRNLSREQEGILKFKATFKRSPEAPTEWAAVRAYGYALK